VHTKHEVWSVLLFTATGEGMASSTGTSRLSHCTVCHERNATSLTCATLLQDCSKCKISSPRTWLKAVKWLSKDHITQSTALQCAGLLEKEFSNNMHSTTWTLMVQMKGLKFSKNLGAISWNDLWTSLLSSALCLMYLNIFICMGQGNCDKWVPVAMAWHVLRSRIKERPSIWRVAANILHTQSWTANKGWSSSLGVGRSANNFSPQKRILLQNIHTESLGPGMILWCNLSKEKGTWDLVRGILGACIGQVPLQQQPGN